MRKRAGPKKGPRSTGGEKLANGELQAVLRGRGLRYAAQDDHIIKRKRAGRGFSMTMLAKIVQEAGSQPSHPPPRSGGGSMRSMAEGARST